MVDRLVNSEANTRRITFVEQCFGTSGQHLTIPGRVLVGEGVLTKLCRKKPKPRQFFLFNDILVYGNIVINKKRYNKQLVIHLEDVKLGNVEDEGSLRNGWKIVSPSKSFIVYAATATEKSEWMAHIKKCVQDLLLKQGKTQSSTDDSPVWVPDHEASTCMNCRKTQFSVINRRHHCRRCGILVCNPCSNKRWLFPQQSPKPLRVCVKCFDKLFKAQTGNQPIPDFEPAGNEESSGEDSSDDDDEEEETSPVTQTGSAGDAAPEIGTFYSGTENSAA